jgi:O-antigen ligase
MNLRDRRISTIAASVSFWTWCGLLSYPMISENVDFGDPGETFAHSRTAIICQVAGLVLFLTTICPTYFARISSTIANLNLAQIAIFLIICLSFALQLHDDEAATLTGIFYTGLILVTALTLSVLWTLAPADFERCMSVASVILCLFGISAIAILGLPEGRNIGGIQPNLFAAPLLAGFIFSQFRAGPIGVVVRILCFGMVALVSSRFALIGCITAIVMHELIFDPLSPGKIPALIIAVVAGILFWPQIISVLALDDSTRDLSSGLAGRDQLWYGALAKIAENPFGIGFKRTIGNESGHNGYLKTLLEFGIVGGGLIIFLVGCAIAIAGVEAVRSSRKDPQQHRFACARFGGLIALAFGAFFQPQLLNLGDAFGMSLLFLLFKPKMNSISDRSLAGKASHLG